MLTNRASNLLLMALLIALLGGLLLWPIWLTVRGAFESRAGDAWTLYHVQSIFTTPRLVRGLVNALLIATCTTILSLLIALPLSSLVAGYDFRGKNVLGALLLAPLILPPFVGAIGFSHIFGRSGTINTLLIEAGVIDLPIDFIGRGGFWAVVAIEALHLFPILYLNAAAALANVDPTLHEAAENLGASRWRRFRTVTLPLIRPGLFAGSVLVFIWSFTELGTPLMLEYHDVTPVQIFNGIREMNDSAEPYALTCVLLAVAVAIYLLGRGLLRHGDLATAGKAGHQMTPRRLGAGGTAAAWALLLVVVFLACLPHIGVVLTSVSTPGAWYHSVVPVEMTFEHFETALGHPLTVGAIRNSLLFSLAAVALDLVVGVAIAYLIVRTRTPGRLLLDGLSMLPLAAPGLVIAFGYVAMSLEWPFGAGDPLEGWVDVLGANPNPVPLLIAAYAVRRLPYVVRSVVAGLQQTPIELEEASLNLGAGRLRTLWKITLPLIGANLIAGAILAFSFAMLEVSDSLILAQREAHYPITKAIYVLFQRIGDGEHLASAMGVWAMLLLGTTLLGATMLMGRRLGALFRA